MWPVAVTALVLLSTSLPTASPAAAQATLTRDGQRRLRSEDVTRASAGQNSNSHIVPGGPHPSHGPAAGRRRQLHRSPPDPRAPELTIAEAHHSQWSKQHHHQHASPSPAPNSGHSSGHDLVSSSHSVHRTQFGPKHTHGSHSAAHPPPPVDGAPQKVRIQPCSVSHSSAGEQRTAQVCCEYLNNPTGPAVC